MAELLLSIAILTSALIIIIGIFSSGIIGLKKSDTTIIATNVAQSTLEFYSEQVLTRFEDSEYANMAVPLNLGYEIVDSITFEKYLMITDEGNTKPSNKLKKVTVTIYWDEKGIETTFERKKIKFSTLVNNYLD